jgi:hypothetical protein
LKDDAAAVCVSPTGAGLEGMEEVAGPTATDLEGMDVQWIMVAMTMAKVTLVTHQDNHHLTYAMDLITAKKRS